MLSEPSIAIRPANSPNDVVATGPPVMPHIQVPLLAILIIAMSLELDDVFSIVIPFIVIFSLNVLHLISMAIIVSPFESIAISTTDSSI